MPKPQSAAAAHDPKTMTMETADTTTAANKVQIGPQSTLKADCTKHVGYKIIFKLDSVEDKEKDSADLCEKCFAEIVANKSKNDTRNSAQ